MLRESLSVIHLEKNPTHKTQTHTKKTTWNQKKQHGNSSKCSMQNMISNRWIKRAGFMVGKDSLNCLSQNNSRRYRKQLSLRCPHVCDHCPMPLRAPLSTVSQLPGNPSFWYEEDWKSKVSNMFCMKATWKDFYFYTIFNYQKVIISWNSQCSLWSWVRQMLYDMN